VSESFTVVASVGTYHHPFDRFVQWLEPWAMKNRASVVFQHGSTRPMRGSENHEVLSPKELLRHYRAADAIVLQGGAGGVMDARKAGRIPIVVPRIPIDQEVVDDHQVVLCRRLAEMGVVHVAESAADLARLLDGTRAGTIPSRVRSRRDTPGVRQAVSLLGSGQTTSSYRLERGEVTLSPRLRQRWPSVRNMATSLIHRGLLGYVLAFATAVVLLDRVQLSTSYEAMTLGAVGAWLLCSFTVLPAYERARSFQPVLWFVAALGVGLMIALLAGTEGMPDLRRAVGVGLASAAVICASSAFARLVFRRTPTVLVGDEPSVRRLANRWHEREDVKVVATCAWRNGRKHAIPENSLSELMPQVLGAVARNHARSVVIASEESLTTPTLRDLAWALQRAGVECVVLANGNAKGENVRARQVVDQMALTTRPPAERVVATAAKAAFDRLVAALALVVLAPLLISVGLAVRLTTRHPAILRQARTGRDGRTYGMYTFRTLIARPAADLRISRLGRFLRKTSIDELPRLVNVLKGDMSLVGPRPSPPSETVRYTDRMWRRLSVRPGVTGLSQVSGRSRLSPEETISIDLQYVDHWNLRLDARILARTLGVALTRDVTR
jgi:lipopolysaccharide/colanic/teichoic acid biosynthesis glycosyltransferase/UDP-N-acetylglucosamine transferase subunit ALG13